MQLSKLYLALGIRRLVQRLREFQQFRRRLYPFTKYLSDALTFRLKRYRSHKKSL
jgi:hypothetical protein